MILHNLRIHCLNNLTRRFYSTPKKSNPQESIRNIGILAHIDAGKKTNNYNYEF